MTFSITDKLKIYLSKRQLRLHYNFHSSTMKQTNIYIHYSSNKQLHKNIRKFCVKLLDIYAGYLVSHSRATPRNIQWSGCWLVFKFKQKIYVRSVRLGFLYTGHSNNLASFAPDAFTAYMCTTGNDVNNTFGCGSTSRQLRRSHPAPSKNNP